MERIHRKWNLLLLSHVQLFATPRAIDFQAPLSMGFSRQEYWSGVPLPSPEDISSLAYSIVFLYFFALKKAFLSLLAVLLNSVFSWVYLSLSPLPFASLLSLALCKASSHNHFAFLHLFFFGMVLITASCTVLQTSVHSSSGTLFTRSNPLNLFVTSSV